MVEISEIPGKYISPDKECIVTEPMLTCNVGTINPNETKIIFSQREINKIAVPNIYPNKFTVVSPGICSVTLTENIHVAIPVASLFVTKIAIPNITKPNGLINYIITLINTSAIDANIINLVDTSTVPGLFDPLPDGFTRTDMGIQTIIPVLRSGENRVFNLQFRVDTNAQLGQYNNIVSAKAINSQIAISPDVVVIIELEVSQSEEIGTIDISGPNTCKPNGFDTNVKNIETGDIINVLPQAAKLSISKNVTPSIIPTRLPMDDITYTINIKNTGDTVAKNIKIFDFDVLPGKFGKLPDGFVRISDMTFLGDVGDLEIGQLYTLIMTFTPSINIVPTTYSNIATITLDNGEVNNYVVSADVTVVSEPKLLVTKTVRVNGNKINYFFVIENKGSTVVRNINISDVSTLVAPFTELPPGFVANNQNTGFVGKIDKIGPNIFHGFTAVQTIPIGASSADHTNTVNVTADGQDQVSSTANFRINEEPLPILSINQITDKNSHIYSDGEIIRYTIEVTNISNDLVANGVKLIDHSTVPGYFTGTPCHTGTNKQIFECDIGRLLAGETYITGATYLINNNTSGIFNNKISATSTNAVTVSKQIDIIVEPLAKLS
jgi:hypothetical protein